jgi:hypothetical protein
MQVVFELDLTPEYLMSTFDISSLTNSQQGFSNITSGFEKARSTFNSTSKLKVIDCDSDHIEFHKLCSLEC